MSDDFQRYLVSNAKNSNHYIATYRFQDRVCRLMETKKLTQTALAAKIGINRSTLGRWLGSGQKLTIFNASRIAKALGQTVSFSMKPEKK